VGLRLGWPEGFPWPVCPLPDTLRPREGPDAREAGEADSRAGGDRPQRRGRPIAAPGRPPTWVGHRQV